jgi:hypothetical protein
MKKLTLILLFSTMAFSSTSYAGWTKLGETANGDPFYVDFERIRKNDGYIYWWQMMDLLKPNKFGFLSNKSYKQGDCKLFRYKDLSYSFHRESMSEGTGVIIYPTKEDQANWTYPSPDSASELTLQSVCSR